MRKPNYTPEQEQKLLADMAAHYGKDLLSLNEINAYVTKTKVPYPRFIFSSKNNYKVKWGQYRVRGTDTSKPESNLSALVPQAVKAAVNVAPVHETHVHTALVRKVAAENTEKFYAEKDPTYVPFGFYNDLKTIIESRIFYTVYIVGLSGNGKTKMVEQVCAQLAHAGREYVRVNITKETDEIDLLGAYDLIDGNTVRRDGPVTIAMKRGAVLLLDEVDLGSERLLCLQPILEGRPFFDKKTGAIVHPAPGFNIIATANTKGKGSDDGRFIGANVLNEAFLERFAITVEQEYAPEKTEVQILKKNMDALGVKDDAFAVNLVKWADMTRKTFKAGAADELISTRRLTHIVKAYGIFKNKMKALELCLNRFDDETKQSFIDAYTKVDAEAVPHVQTDEFNIVGEDPFNDPAERLQKTVQSTVMPPAVQRPAAPAPVTTQAPPAATPVTPAPGWTAPPRGAAQTNMTSQMPPWASAAHIMKVTMGMSEPSPVEISPNGNGHDVKAYGVTCHIPTTAVMQGSIDVILEQAVKYCYDFKKNGNAMNPFPQN